MANTKFEDVYARCRARIKDYDRQAYSEELFEEAEHSLLIAAIDDFADICLQDLKDYDDELLEWNIELTRKEQSILALAMIVHWTEPYIYNSDALRNMMSTKDFTFFSPANLLEKMTALLQYSKQQLKAEINEYSFRSNLKEISDLNGKTTRW